MKRIALIGLVVMMAFVMAAPVINAQQDTKQQAPQGEFVCPRASGNAAGAPCPRYGRMGGGRHRMGGGCMMRGQATPANCPRYGSTANTDNPPIKQ
jgi:hypothetical protein